MPAIIAFVKFVWAWVLPYVGPLRAAALPWLLPLAPLANVWRVIALGAVLAAVFAGVWWLATPEQKMTVAEAKQACEDANARAELAATREALRQAQETLRWRAKAIDIAEAEIDTLTKKMEDLRATAPDPDAPVFAADDPWLRQRSR